MFDVLAVQRALDRVSKAILDEWSEDDRGAAVQAFLAEYRKQIGVPDGAPDWDLFQPLETLRHSLAAINDPNRAATVQYVIVTLIAGRKRQAELN
jgi:hypothetical protein